MLEVLWQAKEGFLVADRKLEGSGFGPGWRYGFIWNELVPKVKG